ncbi:MAG TPA: hypothetical protein PLX89_05020 [Verrucomicrobiota bacterium]|nr:hypothetical protein [Verrucomicrobiales bacterium]HRI12348.1 hypothetical protein [Verrucomicrobiota bacterium]
MSLKAFHLVFVTVSVLLMLVMAAWNFGNYRDDGTTQDLVWGSVALGAAAVLVIYGKVFLRKFKDVSFL